jgi:MtN3 and saliva related transmembrane protein
MEQIAIKLLGFSAATCTTLAYAPQFVKVWRTRSTEDISLGMFLIASNAVTIVLAGSILYMKLKYG